MLISLLVSAFLIAQSPQEIEAINKQFLQHLIDNKTTEAIALAEKMLAKYPNSADAHDLVASAHSAAAEALEYADDQAAKRRAHLEVAARHYRRTLELTHVNRASHLHSLAEMHLKAGLNNLAEAERYARRLATDHPSLRSGHAVLIRALLEGGRSKEAVAAIATGRATLDPMDGVQMLADVLLDLEGLERPMIRVVLAEALSLTDAAMKALPDEGRLPMFKATILKMQADRVEESEPRRAALRAESDKLWEQGMELMKRR